MQINAAHARYHTGCALTIATGTEPHAWYEISQMLASSHAHASVSLVCVCVCIVCAHFSVSISCLLSMRVHLQPVRLFHATQSELFLLLWVYISRRSPGPSDMILQRTPNGCTGLLVDHEHTIFAYAGASCIKPRALG